MYQEKPLLILSGADGYVLPKLSIYIEMRKLWPKLPGGPYLRPGDWLLAVDVHVVSDHCALLVALCFDLGDGEARVTKIREGLL